MQPLELGRAGMDCRILRGYWGGNGVRTVVFDQSGVHG